MFGKAERFLKDTKKFLADMVKNMRYDTCHRTVEYDAKVCEKDCKTLEKSEFAQACRKKNGLFKCCIRWRWIYWISLDNMKETCKTISDEIKSFVMSADSAAPCLCALTSLEQPSKIRLLNLTGQQPVLVVVERSQQWWVIRSTWSCTRQMITGVWSL